MARYLLMRLTSMLAPWWQVAEGRCSLESTGEKVVMAKAPVPNSGFAFLF